MLYSAISETLVNLRLVKAGEFEVLHRFTSLITEDYDDSHNVDHHLLVTYHAVFLFQMPDYAELTVSMKRAIVVACMVHDVVDHKYPNADDKERKLTSFLDENFPDKIESLRLDRCFDYTKARADEQGKSLTNMELYEAVKKHYGEKLSILTRYYIKNPYAREIARPYDEAMKYELDWMEECVESDIEINHPFPTHLHPVPLHPISR
jgi:hypothetical protein